MAKMQEQVTQQTQSTPKVIFEGVRRRSVKAVIPKGVHACLVDQRTVADYLHAGYTVIPTKEGDLPSADSILVGLPQDVWEAHELSEDNKRRELLGMKPHIAIGEGLKVTTNDIRMGKPISLKDAAASLPDEVPEIMES